MVNDDRRRAHSEEGKKAAAATVDDAEVTCKKTKITASVAHRRLLFDVLRDVAAQLDPPSFVCFRETCSAWRSAAVAVTDYPHSQRKNSLLALSADPESDFRRLIGPSPNLELSDSYRFRCCGLFEDWIATVTASGRVFLLRQVPVKACVELPPISTLTLQPWFVDNDDNWQKNRSYVKKIALSAPPDSPDCLAVAVYWFNHLAVCRPGDAEWTAVLEPSYSSTEVDQRYFDYIYKDAAFVAPRKLLAVALTGRVVSFEFSSSGSPPVVTLLMPDREQLGDFSREFLANSDGEAVLVKRSSAFGFEVFKLVDDDRGGRMWEKQEGLEGKKAAAVVVSRCGSVCVPVEEAPGLEENCIYFAEARKDKGEPLKAGVFRMSDKSVRWVEKGEGMVPLMLFLFDSKTLF